jgi:hypothetical protein
MEDYTIIQLYGLILRSPLFSIKVCFLARSRGRLEAQVCNEQDGNICPKKAMMSDLIDTELER